MKQRPFFKEPERRNFFIDPEDAESSDIGRSGRFPEGAAILIAVALGLGLLVIAAALLLR